MTQAILSVSVLLALNRLAIANAPLTVARRLTMLWVAWSLWRLFARII